MKFRWLFLLSIAIITFQLLIYNANFSNRINWLLYDYLIAYTAKDTSLKNPQTVVVEIDEKSLEVFGQWPWPRVMTAQILKKIDQYKPQSITMDVLFVENDRTSLNQITNFYLNFFNLNVGLSGLPDIFFDNDAILADAVLTTNTILPVYLTYQEKPQKRCNVTSLEVDNKDCFNTLKSYQGVLCSLQKIHNSASYTGFMNSHLDSDGRYRRMPLVVKYKDNIVPSLAMSPLVKLFQDIKIEPANLLLGDYSLKVLDKKIFLDESLNVLLNFYPRQWYTKVSAFDLLSNNIDPNLLIGKHIFLGTTAEGIQNLYNVAEDKKLPGIHTYATFVENFFNNDLKVEPSSFQIIMVILSIFLTLCMTVLLVFNKFLYAIVVFFTSFVISILLSFILISTGLYISLGYFIVPFISTFIILMFLYTIINFIEQKNFYKKLSATLELKVQERTKDLNTEKEKVEVLHKETQDSINFALLIQKAILPENRLFENYFKEYFVLWQPRDTIGGDIYFLEELKKDEEIVLFVIDCTSHGVPGALVTILVKAVEQQIVSYLLKHPDEIDPSFILQEFNRSIKKLLRQYDKSSVSDVGFEGGILCYNKKSGRVLYSGSGTTLFSVENNTVKSYKGDRHPIGYIRSDPDFVFKVYELDSAMIEILYISTDGYLDQKGGKKGFPLGRRNFINFLESQHSKSLTEQYDAFKEMIETYKGEHDNTDDMTMVGLKI